MEVKEKGPDPRICLYWASCTGCTNRDMESTINFLCRKFGKKAGYSKSNIKALQAGFNYGDTNQSIYHRYKVEKAKMEPGVYYVPSWVTSRWPMA